MEKTLAERLRDVGCDREPFTPDHAHCVCRLTGAAADALEKIEARYTALQCIAGTLAVHVQGHFAMPTEHSEAICKKWASATHDEATGKT